MKYSIQIPLIVTAYFVVTIFYTFYESNSIWMHILWAFQKNGLVFFALFWLYDQKKVIWSDRLFIGAAIINICLQSTMYLLCPFSTQSVKKFYFDLFGWFTIVCAITSICCYVNELFKPNRG